MDLFPKYAFLVISFTTKAITTTKVSVQNTIIMTNKINQKSHDIQKLKPLRDKGYHFPIGHSAVFSFVLTGM